MKTTKPAMKTLEPIHNKGVKLELEVFAICKTENALAEMRELNIVATRILMNERHPIRHFFTNHRIQDEYAMRKGTTSPIFMKSIDKFGELGVDTRKVETAPSYNRAPWKIDTDKCLDFTMCTITKRTYAALLWWKKASQISVNRKTAQLQRLACVSITGSCILHQLQLWRSY
jgi:hypothetical protein